MRIVSGKHKGRPILAPKGSDTRPTSDRAREAIFNVLEHGVPGPGLRGAKVGDIFAGTGALGLEALSRGAEHCVFVEQNPNAVRTLKDNIQTLGAGGAAKVISKDATALGPRAGAPFEYAFLDAPYNQALSEAALLCLAAQGWLADGCVLMVEVAKAEILTPPPGFDVLKEKTYGAARAVFLTYTF